MQKKIRIGNMTEIIEWMCHFIWFCHIRYDDHVWYEKSNLHWQLELTQMLKNRTWDTYRYDKATVGIQSGGIGTTGLKTWGTWEKRSSGMWHNEIRLGLQCNVNEMCSKCWWGVKNVVVRCGNSVRRFGWDESRQCRQEQDSYMIEKMMLCCELDIKRDEWRQVS